MPSANVHRDRARVDEKFADELASRVQPIDWELIARFYSALHLIEAYFTLKDARFRAQRHPDRTQAIRESPELSKGGRFPTAYKRLQDMSEQVRYDPGFRAQPADYASARDSLRLIRSFLDPKLASAIGAG